MIIDEEYALVIDTDSSASPFFKQLCAYCTGYCDEKDQEQKFSDLFYLEMGIDDDESPRGKIADEKNPFSECIFDKEVDGTFSPCSLWASPTFAYTDENEIIKLTGDNYDLVDLPALFSLGIFFTFQPTEKQFDIVKQRANKFFSEVWPKFSDTKVSIIGFRVIEYTKSAKDITDSIS